MSVRNIYQYEEQGIDIWINSPTDNFTKQPAKKEDDQAFQFSNGRSKRDIKRNFVDSQTKEVKASHKVTLPDSCDDCPNTFAQAIEANLEGNHTLLGHGTGTNTRYLVVAA